MKKREQILVMDVEATCWQTAPPAGMTSEIIEIGITPLYQPKEITHRTMGDSKSIVVKPIQSLVSAFCTHLTGWEQHQVDSLGVSWGDAVARLNREYSPANGVVAFWGKYDDKMFYKMCDLYNIKYPFNNEYLNVKALFAAQYGFACSVKDALTAIGREFEGRPHNGADDSRNIAYILLHLLGPLRSPLSKQT